MIRTYRILALFCAFFAHSAFAAADPPVPFWASLRDATVNMRVGPGEDYRIAWVYHRQHLPVKVIRSMQDWRLVADSQGARGWIMARFLSHQRWATVAGKAPVEMHAGADAASPLRWRLAPGVVGILGGCDEGWCRLDVGGGHAGYVEQARLWGASQP